MPPSLKPRRRLTRKPLSELLDRRPNTSQTRRTLPPGALTGEPWDGAGITGGEINVGVTPGGEIRDGSEMSESEMNDGDHVGTLDGPFGSGVFGSPMGGDSDSDSDSDSD